MPLIICFSGSMERKPLWTAIWVSYMIVLAAVFLIWRLAFLLILFSLYTVINLFLSSAMLSEYKMLVPLFILLYFLLPSSTPHSLQFSSLIVFFSFKNLFFLPKSYCSFSIYEELTIYSSINFIMTKLYQEACPFLIIFK